ncbi:MAG: chorismate mutase / prephenate dehydratase [Rhodospirillaceae bacterium]|jgi:chorismate mutase-like protein|nr:chorismate mutase / prephenate dehydratase [Rhodospirillaceae bacterium]
MADAEPTLDALRAEIDSIDEQLHRLIMRRADVTLGIGAIKNASQPNAALMRPGREAEVLRRLAARHEGAFPKSVVIRLWRELIGAVLRLQGPFSVAVYAPEAANGYWDLARDHFGSLTPATAHDSPQQVLNAVLGGRATVGVLPLPGDGDDQPWWPMLLSKDAKHPRVVSRLPFGAGETVRGGPIEAFAVAQCPAESTGRDRSLLVVETTAEMSRSALAAESRAIGLEIGVIQSWHPPSEPTWLHLVEVDGYVAADDARLGHLETRLSKALRQIWPIGGYAVPFSAAELGTAKKG